MQSQLVAAVEQHHHQPQVVGALPGVGLSLNLLALLAQVALHQLRAVIPATITSLLVGEVVQQEILVAVLALPKLGALIIGALLVEFLQ
jgi:hypothetical protein